MLECWRIGEDSELGLGCRTRSRAPSFCMTECKDILLLFSMGEGPVALSMHPEEHPP